MAPSDKPSTTSPAEGSLPGGTPPGTDPTASGRLAGWASALRVYLEPATLRMLFRGFSAGLPLLLVLGTLGFRLREAGIDRTTIGYLSWVGLAYGFKWAWAPLVDRLPLPLLTRWLGRRRSWGWSGGASARFSAPCASCCRYCCKAIRSTCSAGASLVKAELLPTSTPSRSGAA